jgi:catechol 2,3-dioxygenase-like lactoylglutathione lyase family enzyme
MSAIQNSSTERTQMTKHTALALAFVAMSGVAARSAPAQERPRITGVSHLAIYTSDSAKTEEFFVHDLGAVKRSDPENTAGTRYYFNSDQFVEVLPMPATSAGGEKNRLDHSAFRVSDAEKMRVYLAKNGVDVPAAATKASDGSSYFEAKDPEGNRIEFVQPPSHSEHVDANPLSDHIIHVGFIVHDAAAEDAFYVKLLGFRPYWHGGMKENETDWISQQVPDGTDWLEYMMVKGPEKTGIPASMSQETAGVLDHFALGVVNMEKAVNLLTEGDRLTMRHSPPLIGRDGKWQLNMYAPDGTRAELMEFQPSIKPCCSPILLPSPTK